MACHHIILHASKNMLQYTCTSIYPGDSGYILPSIGTQTGLCG